MISWTPIFRARASADRGEVARKVPTNVKDTQLNSPDMTWNEITGSVSTKRVWRTTNISLARVHHFRSVPVLKVLPTMPVHCMAFRPSMLCGIPVWRRKATVSNSYNCPARRSHRSSTRSPHRYCSIIFIRVATAPVLLIYRDASVRSN